MLHVILCSWVGEMKGTLNVQLKDITKPIDQMTDDELMTRLRTVRHSRETIRPAARKHIERAETKATRVKMSAMDKVLEGMSDSDREELLKQLKEQEAGSEQGTSEG